ncbi:hypothetical protein SAY86_018877 [Trapa natans]|uniref:Uncharacterized protein n=1 Tax=Trapa natans TaxID=22666 RepID=A0AAN7LH24_TRANT|nr:hypothetical protein SAY86_018877 [Trapa natans]
MTMMTNPGKPDRRPSFALFPRILLSMAPEKHPRIVKLLQALFILVVFVAGYVIGMTATSSSYISQYFGARSGNLVDSAPPHRRACGCDCHNTDCSSTDSYLHLRRNLSHGMSDGELLGGRRWCLDRKTTRLAACRGWPSCSSPEGRCRCCSSGRGSSRGKIGTCTRSMCMLFPGIDSTSPVTRHSMEDKSPARVGDGGAVRRGEAAAGERPARLLQRAVCPPIESCIPVHNFLTIYTYLTGSNHSFVESYDEPTRFGRGRYSRNMLPDIHLRQWRKGSQWFELDRDLATYIVSDTKYYSLFRKFCKPACYPDEHYIPTYLNMFHGWKNSNRSVTWVDWSTRASHPASFEKGNVTAYLIRSIRSNGTLCRYNDRKTDICYLFARKFAPSALGPLLELSSTVMGF